MADFTTAAFSWLRQSTTGQGGAIVIGTAVALLEHQMTLETAIPVLAAGVLLIIFPQAPAGVAPAVQQLATDGEALFDAFKAGNTHGLSSVEAAFNVVTPTRLAGDVSELVSALHANTAATKESSAALPASAPPSSTPT
jgi:hypothetical protein